ncbi:hypothetical protein ACFXDJ_15035 [Streptomyces sp. NPDC059443]|uniref:hypothetical protein n=1 Tax=unclassified Streptomyces TaxID=2593676 RepID=UPI003673F486
MTGPVDRADPQHEGPGAPNPLRTISLATSKLTGNARRDHIARKAVRDGLTVFAVRPATCAECAGSKYDECGSFAQRKQRHMDVPRSGP